MANLTTEYKNFVGFITTTPSWFASLANDVVLINRQINAVSPSCPALEHAAPHSLACPAMGHSQGSPYELAVAASTRCRYTEASTT